MNKRELRGRQIVKARERITRIDDTHYTVKSQSRNKTHDIISTEHGRSCSCEDHQSRKACRKHIHAVEVSIKMHQKAYDDVVISEVAIDTCKYCKSANITKMGVRHNENYDAQMFSCKDCNRKFSIHILRNLLQIV